MKYLVAHFKIRCAGEELQTARDLLADEAAGAVLSLSKRRKKDLTVMYNVT